MTHWRGIKFLLKTVARNRALPPTTCDHQLQVDFDEGRNFGEKGEDLAVDYLANHGFKIIARNVKYKTGEIDIIAKRKKELHFIEVKTRRDFRLGSPFDAITETKKKRLKRTAEWFLSDYRNNFKNKELSPCYFSVIGIDFTDGKPRIECILDAFV